MASPKNKNPFSAALRLQEGGLLVVIFVLGVLLTIFGGSVKVAKFQTNAAGERERVFTTSPDGEKVPVVEERNKFLNSQNNALRDVRTAWKRLLHQTSLPIEQRMTQCAERLVAFGPSAVQELVGWFAPTRYPLRNANADAGLRFLGF